MRRFPWSRRPLIVEQLEDRTLLAAPPSSIALVISPSGKIIDPNTGNSAVGSLAATPLFYNFNLTQDGRAAASLALPANAHAALTLLASDGSFLVVSDGVPSSSTTAWIDQHLTGDDFTPTTYYLEVQSLDPSPSGTFTLNATFRVTSDPFISLSLGTPPTLPIQNFAVPLSAMAQLTSNTFLDLAIVNPNANRVSVFLPAGDGTFLPRKDYPVGNTPVAIVAAQLTNSGRTDLAIADQAPAGQGFVTVLLNQGTDAAGDPIFTRQDIAVPGHPEALVVGNFGDAGLDIAVASLADLSFTGQPGSVTVLHNNGSGSFSTNAATDTSAVGSDPTFLVAADFNGDTHLDLATANADADPSGGQGVSVLPGLGSGHFAAVQAFTAGRTPLSLTVANVNGDALPDLLVADSYTFPQTGEPSGGVTVLLGSAAGPLLTPAPVMADPNFPALPAGTFAFGTHPSILVVADFNHDSHLDVAGVHNGVPDVAVALGKGDGTFQTPLLYQAVTGTLGQLLSTFVMADVNGDGQPDLITGNNFGDHVSVLLGNPDGTFQAPQEFQLEPGITDPTAVAIDDEYDGFGIAAIQAADVSGDGRPDLLVVSQYAEQQDVSVLENISGGQFQQPRVFSTGFLPTTFLEADFNSDGIPDLAVLAPTPDGVALPPPPGQNQVSILLGVGDGTFRSQLVLPGNEFGGNLIAMVTTDFNGDNRPDLAVAVQDFNGGAGHVVVLFGVGDGTFRMGPTLSVGVNPVALLTANLGNGAADLVVVDQGSGSAGDVRVLLDNGAGSFTAQTPLLVPATTNPNTALVGDFNGDHHPDLAVAGSTSAVSVLLGNGNGTFQTAQTFTVGQGPHLLALVPSGLNDDGTDDLVVTNHGSGANGSVSVLHSVVNGASWQFTQPFGPFAVSGQPTALAVADFSTNGTNDIAVTTDFATSMGGNVSVLLETKNAGTGNWTGYAAEQRFSVDEQPPALLAGNFEHNGRADLAVLSLHSDTVTLLVNQGVNSGTWQGFTRETLDAGGGPSALLSADFNLDGNIDLAVLNSNSSDVIELLGSSTGAFADSSKISVPIRATPLVADLDGDGTPDVVVLNEAGQILFRHGRTDVLGTFDPPIVVNASQGVRDVTVVNTPQGNGLAAVTTTGHSVVVFTYSATPAPQFTAVQTIPFSGSVLPVRILAANLDNNADHRNDDLIVLDSSNQQIFFLTPGTGGAYQITETLDLPGQGFSDLAVIAEADGFPDVAVTNQQAGSVLLLVNDLHGNPAAGPGRFALGPMFRGGAGLYGLDNNTPSPTVVSEEGTDGVVAGPFFGSGQPNDLLVLNAGSNSFAVLQGNGSGSFLNPVVNPLSNQTTPFPLGFIPSAVTVGDFNHDGKMDLAMLDGSAGVVHIYLGNGNGTFQTLQSIAAGNVPTGLTVITDPQSGFQDLLVGNQFGDVLELLGNGDGTFRPYQRLDQNVALALLSDNQFVYGNQGQDQVLIGDAQGLHATFNQTRQDGILAPGAVQLADLNGDTIPDLIVANSGSNDVLVYLGLGNNQFALTPHTFFTGTNPANVTVANFNGDLIPDLAVPNQGSNDVSILLGQGTGANWTLTPGPRLRAGTGPVFTVATDLNSDNVTDLAIVNSVSNNVDVLKGLGGGFFTDQAPAVIATGSNPRQAFIGPFAVAGEQDLVTINAGSNDVTFVANVGAVLAGQSVTPKEIPVGGSPVTAATGDFNHDGLLDLVLALNSGALVLGLGAAGGPQFDPQTMTPLSVSHPTAIVILGFGPGVSPFAAVSSPAVQGYAAGDGQNMAVRFMLSLPGAPPSNLVAVANQFTHSPEYFTNLIEADYQHYLGRPADPGGLAFWLSQLQGGLSDEHLEASFFSSPEFINDHNGLGADWVNAVYEADLGRQADPSGLNFFLGQLAANVSPATITFEFAASPERESQRIAADYLRYLDRPLDPGGQAFWVDQFVNHGDSNENVIAGFVGSPEYFRAPAKGDSLVAAWINAAFLDVLGRAAGSHDIAFWSTVLH